MGLSADITERKGVDEALRASEARLVAGADLAGLGFYEVNHETRTAFLDARLRLLLGLPPEPAPDLSDVELFMSRVHPDDGPSFFEQRGQLHDGRVPEVSVEYRYLHPTRGERWLDHVARIATRDTEGRVLKAYGVIRDITARRQREAALRDSLAEIERLRDRLQAENDYLKAEIKLAHAHGEITGKSAAIRKVLRQVEQVAPTGSTVLISGETGTGKELVARAIHRLSPRHGRLMVSVNCAALPSGLLESELFGRERGAYTGAMTRQVGRFEVADGSTLFLDEVGELSLEMQAKLLRVLETGAFERLGSPRAIRVDVRVIAATHRDLADDVRNGRFREDLFYRLNVFPIRVPPLRERTEDLPLLVWALLEECSARMGKKITKVPRLTMEALQRRPWPGNVRELRNMIEHAVIVTEGEVLRCRCSKSPRRRRRHRERWPNPSARSSSARSREPAGTSRGRTARPRDSGSSRRRCTAACGSWGSALPRRKKTARSSGPRLRARDQIRTRGRHVVPGPSSSFDPRCPGSNEVPIAQRVSESRRDRHSHWHESSNTTEDDRRNSQDQPGAAPARRRPRDPPVRPGAGAGPAGLHRLPRLRGAR